MEQTAIAVAGKAPASSSTVCDWTELPADLVGRIFGTLQIPDTLLFLLWRPFSYQKAKTNAKEELICVRETMQRLVAAVSAWLRANGLPSLSRRSSS
jgi:hypothetical protein